MRKADFKITSKGDLVFLDETNKNEKMQIEFYKAKSNALRIEFAVKNTSENLTRQNSLTINFEVIKPKNNKKAKIISNDSYLIQQALIRIKTVQGELYKRPNVGSTLEPIMHKNIYDSKIIGLVESKISEALKDIMDNYIVKATPIIERNNGYRQVIKIKVYNNNALLINYEME